MKSIEGLIVNSINQVRKRIEIDEYTGLITWVGEPTGDADLMLGNELIFPGFIDLHVHAREDTSHTQDYKEDFSSAGEAAINGGIVAFAEMPNNPVPPVDDASYNAKKELTEKSPVKIILYAGIGPETNPLNKKVPYKAFMGHSIGNLFFTTHEMLDTTLARYVGQNISFHCEDPKILEESKDEPTHSLRRPPKAEVTAIDFALKLIKKYNLTGKICHCSTVEGMEKIIRAKKEGIKVTVEVTPTHLFFDRETVVQVKEEGFMQMNPPIRKEKLDRMKLIEYLRHGDIDYLATDHAPHTIEEKKQGISGIPQLDTYSEFIVWLMHEHHFTPQDIMRICSFNPAQFINQFTSEKYGEIAEGYVGSLAIIDPHRPTTITKELLKTKCGWSPFEGMEFPGCATMTIIKGKVYAK